jgi:MFS family permease
MVKKRNVKIPWLAALLNFIIPGVGYVYAGKRVGFGVGLIVWSILSFIIYSFFPYPEGYNPWQADFLVQFLICLVFAYDGYKTAEEVNGRKRL